MNKILLIEERCNKMSQLGTNIKVERKRQNISLQDLASRVQVSPSFLSQIENGKNEPSLTTLKRISTCLGVTVSKLLGEDESIRTMLIKKDSRHKLSNLVDGFEIEFISAFDPKQVMEACVHVLSPDGQSGKVPYTHAGQELFFVLEGSIKLNVDGEMMDMEEGDSYYLTDCTKAHYFFNASTKSHRMKQTATRRLSLTAQYRKTEAAGR